MRIFASSIILLLGLGAQAALPPSAQPTSMTDAEIYNLTQSIHRLTKAKYSQVKTLPKVYLISAEDLVTILGDGSAASEAYRGVYTPSQGLHNEVFLNEHLNVIENYCDRGVLVHELVHYLQFAQLKIENPVLYAEIKSGTLSEENRAQAKELSNIREDEAYHIQYLWAQTQPSHVRLGVALDTRRTCSPIINGVL